MSSSANRVFAGPGCWDSSGGPCGEKVPVGEKSATSGVLNIASATDGSAELHSRPKELHALREVGTGRRRLLRRNRRHPARLSRSTTFRTEADNPYQKTTSEELLAAITVSRIDGPAPGGSAFPSRSGRHVPVFVSRNFQRLRGCVLVGSPSSSRDRRFSGGLRAGDAIASQKPSLSGLVKRRVQVWQASVVL